jgi:hypothetical protein
VRPLYAVVVAHVASSYLAGAVLIGLGFAIIPEGMARSATASGWAKTFAGSPIVFPVVPVVVLATEGARRSPAVPYVVSLAAYVLTLPVTSLVARRLWRKPKP